MNEDELFLEEQNQDNEDEVFDPDDYDLDEEAE